MEKQNRLEYLDESKSPKDCTIAILNIYEKYEDLAKSLEDICHEASHLDTIGKHKRYNYLWEEI